MNYFTFSRTPQVLFGAGTFSRLGGILRDYGARVLVFTGGSSLEASGRSHALAEDLKSKGIDAVFIGITEEPSPETVDSIVGQFHADGDIGAVCSVGGGSVIDAGKAVSAMLPSGDSVFDYLEGVGTGKVHDGSKVPFIAVPTTAGTGSEATKNAVLSRTGKNGFKKSLRHDNFVPDMALIDPELALTCPKHVTAASGMDALCQLAESYVSTKAGPITDILALEGLEHAAANLLKACGSGGGDTHVRAGMAYAAFLSGITLANAGLGVVHGFASSVGGMFDIPHGVVCGTLLAEATAVTIAALRDTGHSGQPYLKKYARIGSLLSAYSGTSVDHACDRLVITLRKWTDSLEIPRLGVYGVTEADIDSILDITDVKNNPGSLSRDDMRRIIEARL